MNLAESGCSAKLFGHPRLGWENIMFLYDFASFVKVGSHLVSLSSRYIFSEINLLEMFFIYFPSQLCSLRKEVPDE